MIRFTHALACSLLLVAGCFTPNPPSGAIICSSKGECPEGYQCGIDGRCYKSGAPMPTVSASMSTVEVDKMMARADGADVVTITVTVQSDAGRALKDQTVTIAATGSNNTLMQAMTMTGTDGVVRATLVSTRAEIKTISATLGSVEIAQKPTVTFAPGPGSGMISTVMATSPVVADGVATSAIVIGLLDANANPISGQMVQVSATGTGNTIVQPSGPTGADGSATATLASTKAETKTVTITINPGAMELVLAQKPTVQFIPGEVSASVSTVVANPVSSIIANGTSLSTITVTLKDAQGNPISGKTVSLSSTGTMNTLTQPTMATDLMGVATGTIATLKAEEKTITATVIGPPDLVLIPKPKVRFASGNISAGGSTVGVTPAGMPIANGSATVTITVTVLDTNANPVADQEVQISVGGIENTVTPTTTVVTNAQGQAVWTLSSTEAQSKLIVATVNPGASQVILSQQPTVQFIAGPANTITVARLAGETGARVANNSDYFTLVATVRDAQGNVVSGAPINIASSNNTDDAFTPNGNQNSNASGQASWELRTDKAETKTITVSVAGASPAISNTTNVTFDAGAATQIALARSSPPSGDIVADGTATVTLTATVRDGFNNPVPGVDVTIAPGTNNTFTPLPSGTPGTLTVATNASGQSAWTLKSTKAESKNISASALSLTPAQLTVVFVAGAATEILLARSSPPSGNIVANGVDTVTLTATVRDANQNPISGVNVTIGPGTNNTFTPTPGGTPGTLTVATDTSGQAAWTLKSTLAETKNITASALSLTPAQLSVDFVAGAATSFVFNRAPSGNIVAGANVVLTATIQDTNGNGVQGVDVTVSTSGTNHTFTPSTLTRPTGSDGRVSWDFTSTQAITRVIDANTAGFTQQQVSIPFIAGDPANVVLNASPESIEADNITQLSVTANVTDTYGNPINAREMAITTNPASGVFVSPVSTQTTNPSGNVIWQLRGTFVGQVTVTIGTAAPPNASGQKVVTLKLPRPRIIADSVTVGVAGCTAVGYSVRHPTALRPDILVEYSTDGGATYKLASQGTAKGDSGVTAVTAASDAAGTAHVFRWDSARDLPNARNQTVRVRVNALLAGAERGSGDSDFEDVVITNAPLLDFISNVTTYQNATIRGLGAGDINNDGNLDALVSVDLAAGDLVAIRKGDGTGNFQFIDDVAIGNAVGYRIPLADFNDDGHLDFAVSSSSALNVFVNDGTGNFNPAPNTPVAGVFPVGTLPLGVAVADLSHDGKPDIVVTNLGEADITVATNNFPGANSFLLDDYSTLAAGQPTDVVIGDFNRDGWNDIAVTNFTGSSVSVLLHTQSARPNSFTVRTEYTVAANPMGIAAGDFNRDGALDLAVGSFSANHVAILLNSGTGTFPTPYQTFALGGKGRHLHVGDPDRDGIEDLLVSTDAAEMVYLRGIGNGTFAAALTAIAGAPSLGKVLGDFNNDGILDGITSSSAANVYLGKQGNPCGILCSGVAAAPTPRVPLGLAVADFNRDGRPDVAVTAFDADEMRWAPGLGDGTFRWHGPLPAGDRPALAATGDFNEDGFPDLLTTRNLDSPDGRVVYHQFDSASKTFSGAGTTSTVDGWPVSIAVGDFDGDGNLDFVTANGGQVDMSMAGSSDTVSVVYGFGDGTFGINFDYPTGASSKPVNVAIANVDGDAYPDIIIGLNGTGGVGVLFGGGGRSPSSFGDYATFPDALAYTTGIGVADVLGDDQYPDFIYTDGTTNQVGIIAGTGSRGAIFGTMIKRGVCGAPQLLAVGDVAGDSRPDITVACQNGLVTQLLNNGAGSFTRHDARAGDDPFNLSLADVNGDHRLDVITSMNGESAIGVLLRSPSPEPMLVGLRESLQPTAYVTAGDWNRDGKMDLITSPSINLLTIYYGDGAGGFDSTQNHGVSGFATRLLVSDIDRNGHLDVMAAVSDTVNVRRYNNNTMIQSVILAQSIVDPVNDMVLADINHDSRDDLIVSDGRNVYTYWHNTTGATFSDPPSVFFNTDGGNLALTMADVNFDGNADYILTHPNEMRIYLGLANGSWTGPFYFQAPPGVSLIDTAVGDIDGDGKPDLAVASAATDGHGVITLFYWADSAPDEISYGQATAIDFGLSDTSRPRSIELHDVNRDGILDIVMSYSNNDLITISPGTGSGGFDAFVALSQIHYVASAPNTTTPTLNSLALADFNRDGKIDFGFGTNISFGALLQR